MTRDCGQSLEWLEKAIRLGSGKALSAAANIRASFGRLVPENLATVIREELHSYARDELHDSLLDNIRNTQHSRGFPLPTSLVQTRFDGIQAVSPVWSLRAPKTLTNHLI